MVKYKVARPDHPHKGTCQSTSERVVTEHEVRRVVHLLWTYVGRRAWVSGDTKVCVAVLGGVFVWDM